MLGLKLLLFCTDMTGGIKMLSTTLCGLALTVLRIFNAFTLALKFPLSFHVYPLTRLWEVQPDHD